MRRRPALVVAVSVMTTAIGCYESAKAGKLDVVKRVTTTVDGITVDLYSWYDSKKLLRTVALKREGNGNAGHGGYAVQMTYQVKTTNGAVRTVVADGSAEGFGYFVSHERYRTFTDGKQGTIAGKVFKKDDSPLGRNFPVNEKRFLSPDRTWAAHRFTMTYRRYGTIDPIPKDPDTGNDAAPTPTDPSKLKDYAKPITILWVFEAGTDFPRIDTTVDLRQIDGPDRVNFDVRGPYGVLVFDDGKNATVKSVMWGDRYHFKVTQTPVTRNASWTWDRRNTGARYTALIAGKYEMGLMEPAPYELTTLRHGYSDGRNKTSATYHGGNGCPENNQRLPCDWEWPYQSLQYSLPYDDLNSPTNYKKIAWGSAPYYGTGRSLKRIYDTPTTSQPFVGWPKSRKLSYSVCVVLGETIPGGLTKAAAAAGSAWTCAAASP
jgi:hypothetical protein